MMYTDEDILEAANLWARARKAGGQQEFSAIYRRDLWIEPNRYWFHYKSGLDTSGYIDMDMLKYHLARVTRERIIRYMDAVEAATNPSSSAQDD